MASKNNRSQPANVGKPSVVAITYGEPPALPTAGERIGGCVRAVDSPRWCCRACEHRWGTLGRHDFENLAELLSTATAGAMWAVRPEHQHLGIADAVGELEQLWFIDDDAEQARAGVAAAFGGGAAAVCNLLPNARDNLAEQLLQLLRYAERKASNG
jgi:hypothetical protein